MTNLDLKHTHDLELVINFIILNRPKVRKDKKPDNKKLVKPEPAVDPNAEVKKPRSRIDTNMVKLKLLDATRKAIIDKTKKQVCSVALSEGMPAHCAILLC